MFNVNPRPIIASLLLMFSFSPVYAINPKNDHILLQNLSQEVRCKDEGPASAAWSPNGEILAIGDENGIHLYDYNADFEPLTLLTGHTELITNLSWSPDGAQLAGTSLRDITVWIWDIDTGEIVMRFQHLNLDGIVGAGGIQALEWNPDGTMIASSGGDTSTETNTNMRIWSVETGESLKTFNQYPINDVPSVNWNSDGSQLFFANNRGDEDSGIYVWDRTSDEVTRIIPYIIWPVTLDLNSDDRMVFVEDVNYEGNFASIWAIRDATTGAQLATLARPEASLFTAAWHPTESNLIAANSKDGTVRIWNIENSQPLAIMNGGAVDVMGPLPYLYHSLDWRPDGTQLAEAGCDGFVRVWDAITYELIAMFEVAPPAE